MTMPPRRASDLEQPSGSPNYVFRHRFTLSDPYLPYQEHSINFSTDEIDYSGNVYLLSNESDEALLSESKSLILGGLGFRSGEDARRTARWYRRKLERAFALSGVAADFGDRAPTGGVGEEWADEVLRTEGVSLIYDDSRLAVYPFGPTRFVSVSARGFAPATREMLDACINYPLEPERVDDPRFPLAYELWSAAKFDAPLDARFMLLMMSMEVLISPQPRPSQSLAFVNSSIERLASDRDAMSEAEYQSLLGSLRHLRQESIASAGKRLVETLSPREYGGRSPTKLFTECYKVRSDLAHGNLPRPPQELVNQLIGPLELMLRHLIAGAEMTNTVLGKP